MLRDICVERLIHPRSQDKGRQRWDILLSTDPKAAPNYSLDYP